MSGSATIEGINIQATTPNTTLTKTFSELRKRKRNEETDRLSIKYFINLDFTLG